MSDPVIYADVKYKKGLDPNTARSGPQAKEESPEEELVYSTVVTHKTDDTDQPDPTPLESPEEDVVYSTVVTHKTDDTDQPDPTSPVPADSSPKDRSGGTGRRGLLRLAVVVLCILILGAVIVLSLHYSANTSETKQEPPSPSPSPSPTEKSDKTQSSSAGCPPGKCANGWKSHGRQCYFFSKKNLTWTQSRDECVHMRKKSHLAIIQDEDEQIFLMTEIKSNMETLDDKFWIGLNDRKREGQWLWVDNTTLKTSFWMRNQPDDLKSYINPDGEDCVLMGDKYFVMNDAKGWWDTACKTECKFICETETC